MANGTIRKPMMKGYLPCFMVLFAPSVVAEYDYFSG
jgi:hypothetical protein